MKTSPHHYHLLLLLHLLNYQHTRANTCSPGSAHDGSSCVTCIPGRFALERARSPCSVCPQGFYQLEQGQPNCVECSPGQSQDQLAGASCMDCSVGYFSSGTGAATCVQCTTGTTTLKSGATSCSTCPPGKYGIDNTCKECLANHYRGPEDSMCNACMQGYHQPLTAQSFCIPIDGKEVDCRNDWVTLQKKLTVSLSLHKQQDVEQTVEYLKATLIATKQDLATANRHKPACAAYAVAVEDPANFTSDESIVKRCTRKDCDSMLVERVGFDSTSLMVMGSLLFLWVVWSIWYGWRIRGTWTKQIVEEEKEEEEGTRGTKGAHVQGLRSLWLGDSFRGDPSEMIPRIGSGGKVASIDKHEVEKTRRKSGTASVTAGVHYKDLC